MEWSVQSSDAAKAPGSLLPFSLPVPNAEKFCERVGRAVHLLDLLRAKRWVCGFSCLVALSKDSAFMTIVKRETSAIDRIRQKIERIGITESRPSTLRWR